RPRSPWRPRAAAAGPPGGPGRPLPGPCPAPPPRASLGLPRRHAGQTCRTTLSPGGGPASLLRRRAVGGSEGTPPRAGCSQGAVWYLYDDHPSASGDKEVVAACTNPGRAAMRSRVRQGVPGGPACVRFVALLLAGICAWEAEAAKKKSAARG
ncbi:unnamed protein product, partial [Prorocentrum cordatum]